MSASATVLVDLRARAWAKAVPGAEAICRAAVGAALDAADGPRGEVSVVLADDAFLHALNLDHRGHDRPTDVLSFPQLDGPAARPGAADGPLLLGDVAVALETARRDAAQAGRALADHLAHLVVHGTLHLIGHTHEDDADAAAMERLEAAALARLGIADPYARPARAGAG